MVSSLALMLSLCLAFFVAMTVGASSVSVSMAPAIGANSVSVLRGAFLVGIFGFLGAVFQGANVATGVGEEIVDGPLTFKLALVSLAVIGLFIGLGIVFEHSIPAAFSTFGSVAGAGMAAGYAPKTTYWVFVFGIWVATGFAAVFLGMAFSKAFGWLVEQTAVATESLNSVILAIGIVFSFVGGGSQVGLAVGPLVGIAREFGVGLIPLLVFGGAGILLGSWFKSPVMLNVVGRQYAALGPDVSLAVLATAIPLVQIVANVLGVPISYNHIIITCIIGCGITGGGESVDSRKFAGTVASWIATLIGSFGVAYGLYWLLTMN